MRCPCCGRETDNAAGSCSFCTTFIYCNICGAKFCTVHQSLKARDHIATHRSVPLDGGKKGEGGRP